MIRLSDLFEGLFAVGIPCVVATAVSGSLGGGFTKIELALWGCIFWAYLVGKFFTQREASCWKNDAFVFAGFVKYLWKDNPVLINAKWREANPKLAPPWDMGDNSDN